MLGLGSIILHFDWLWFSVMVSVCFQRDVYLSLKILLSHYVCVCVHAYYTHTHIQTHTHTHTYIIYIYIYIYAHTHTHTIIFFVYPLVDTSPLAYLGKKSVRTISKFLQK
jgi:hypothetical protein